MNHDFLIGSAQLNQASESQESGGSGGGITRRSFIKRTGGATVATIVAWNVAANTASAENGGASHSASWKWVVGSPGAPTGYDETPPISKWGYTVKGQYSITPASGYSKISVVVSMKAAGWKTDNYSTTTKTTPSVVLTGNTNGDISCSPNAITTYWTQLGAGTPSLVELILVGNTGGTTTDWWIYAKMEILSIIPTPDGSSLTVTAKCYLHRHSVLYVWPGGGAPYSSATSSDDYSGYQVMRMTVSLLK